jgi:uncharacterized protein YndB with AHSA1/START domain
MINDQLFEFSTPTDTRILISRSFDAKRREVFEAWTNPEQVSLWWDPSGKPLAICEIDLKPRGNFRWVHQAPRGVGHAFVGHYLEITPPDRLVFATKTFADGPESIATLLFVEVDGKTKLTMTIDCPSIEARDALLKMRIDVGTAQTLLNLAHFLERNGEQ